MTKTSQTNWILDFLQKRKKPPRGLFGSTQGLLWILLKKRKDTTDVVSFFLEVTPGFEPGNQGFADPCLTTWLCHHTCFLRGIAMPTHRVGIAVGAGNEARTRYLHLGKVALYQMSYARKWCPEPESNQRHEDFQSSALPTELQRHLFAQQESNGQEKIGDLDGDRTHDL